MRGFAGVTLMLTGLVSAPATTAAAQERPVSSPSQLLFTLQSFQVVGSDYGSEEFVWTPRGLRGAFSFPLVDSDDDVGGSWFGSELVGHAMYEIDDLMERVTTWTHGSGAVQPMIFVHNRLSAVRSHRAVEYLEPELRDQNRIYCVGLRVTW